MGTCRLSIIRAAMAVGVVLTCVAASNAQERTGTILFYREPHANTGYFKPAVFCDGVEVARIENGGYFQITAPEGLHTCTVESLQRPVIEVDVLSGKVAHVHVQLLPGFKEHAALANTTESEYNKQQARLKPSKEWSRDALRTAKAESATPVEAPAQASSKSKDRHSGKFGDLAVSVSKVVVTPSRYQKDRAELEAFVSVANTGKGVICAGLIVTLNATFGLQYRGARARAPHIQEMLPGESAEGSYAFDIKDGVQPVELVFMLANRTIRCGSNLPLRDAFVADEIRLDVRDISITETQPSPH